MGLFSQMRDMAEDLGSAAPTEPQGLAARVQGVPVVTGLTGPPLVPHDEPAAPPVPPEVTAAPCEVREAARRAHAATRRHPPAVHASVD